MKPTYLLDLLKNAKVLKIFILGSSLIVGVCILFLSFVYVKTFERNYAKPLQISTQGQLIPSELVKVEDLFAKEAREHLLTFSTYFFSYDQYNYAARIQKALLLGDSSIQIAYERLKGKELWYSFVVENSMVQTLNSKHASISIGQKGPPWMAFSDGSAFRN